MKPRDRQRVRYLKTIGLAAIMTLTLMTCGDLDMRKYLSSESGYGPVLLVKAPGGTPLENGGSWNFGNVLVGGAGNSLTFTVSNTGVADLIFEGDEELTTFDAVLLSGAGSGAFSVTSSPEVEDFIFGSQTGTGDPLPFTVVFSPAEAGEKTATLLIPTNDWNANPFTLNIVGTGIAAGTNLEASFSADPVSGTTPLQVQFTDTSEGAVTEWEWDFQNDGTADSTEQSPSYTYSQAGTYTVKLVVSDGNDSDMVIKSQLITVVEQETDPPQVTSVSPGDGAVDVLLNTAVTFTFNEQIEASSLTGQVTMSGGGMDIPGSLTPPDLNNKVVFRPDNNLSPDTTYSVTIGTGVTDLSGNALATPYAWSFTTGSTADSTAPTVESVAPADAADDIPVSTNIVIVFSEDIDSSTLGSAFSLASGTDTADLSMQYNESSYTATFTLLADLDADTLYSATLSTALTDLAGNPLASAYQWGFTTAAGGSSAAEVDSIGVAINESEYTEGDDINVTITAKDSEEAAVSGFGNAISLSAEDEAFNTLTVSPSSVTPTDGVWTGTVGITGLTESSTVTLSAGYGGITGTDTVSGMLPPATTKFLVSVDEGQISNGETVTLTIKAANDADVVDTVFTDATIALSAAAGGESVDLNPAVASMGAGDNGSVTLNVAVSGLADTATDVTITATGSNPAITGTSDAFTVRVLEGSLVEDAAFEDDGQVISTGTGHIAPREPDNTLANAIDVAGDIVIDAGAKLIIYEGVTLNMNDHQIIVHGVLEVRGTDEKRVLLTSGGEWKGIYLRGSGTGTGADINGAVILKVDTDNYPVRIGYSSGEPAGNVSITNSRILYSYGYKELIYGYFPHGSEYTFEHNILERNASASQEAIYMTNLDQTATVSIRYNTVVLNGTYGGTGFYITDGSSSTYTIERNLMAGDESPLRVFSTGIQVYSNPVFNFRYNLFRVRIDFTIGDFETKTGNLFEEISGDEDNMNFTWNSSNVYSDFAAGDYRLQTDNSPYPSLTQAGSISEMTGCLTGGHENEVGAYGDGGYPPTPDEY